MCYVIRYFQCPTIHTENVTYVAFVPINVVYNEYKVQYQLNNNQLKADSNEMQKNDNLMLRYDIVGFTIALDTLYFILGTLMH